MMGPAEAGGNGRIGDGPRLRGPDGQGYTLPGLESGRQGPGLPFPLFVPAICRAPTTADTTPALTMFSLVLAGEAIFVPPFHLGRYFKSSLLSSFHIDEFQLGQLGAVYGVVAMACYFLGGPLADRFAPRKLLTVSLLATGLGSLYMSTSPSFAGLYGLYAFWGASTILIFWAPSDSVHPRLGR